MDVESFRAAIATPGAGALALAFAAGLLFSVNPVAVAAIPVSLAYVTRHRTPATAARFAGAFVLGMIAVHAVLGFAAGLGGEWAKDAFGRAWALVLGPLLVVLGLAWPGWIRLPLAAPALRARRATSLAGAAALGGGFAVAVCPVCTPTLAVLLGVAAGLGSASFGVALAVAFALGRAVPLALGAIGLGWLETLRPLERCGRAFEIAGAAVLVAAGLYLLTAYFLIVPDPAA
jgi:cytochrome c-type biogenesis protein